MKLYLLRHGEADWPGWSRSDDERPLTPEGKEKMRRSAKFLADRGVSPDVILSSPLPRASQTAELIAAALRMEVKEDPRLGPGFGHEKLSQIVAEYSDKDIMLVGHEPGMSMVIWDLTGGRVKMAKGGLARVDLDDPSDLRGHLVSLIPPKISAR
jgi:phosphohistidine phosphatase